MRIKQTDGLAAFDVDTFLREGVDGMDTSRETGKTEQDEDDIERHPDIPGKSGSQVTATNDEFAHHDVNHDEEDMEVHPDLKKTGAVSEGSECDCCEGCPNCDCQDCKADGLDEQDSECSCDCEKESCPECDHGGCIACESCECDCKPELTEGSSCDCCEDCPDCKCSDCEAEDLEESSDSDDDDDEEDDEEELEESRARRHRLHEQGYLVYMNQVLVGDVLGVNGSDVVGKVTDIDFDGQRIQIDGGQYYNVAELHYSYGPTGAEGKLVQTESTRRRLKKVLESKGSIRDAILR